MNNSRYNQSSGLLLTHRMTGILTYDHIGGNSMALELLYICERCGERSANVFRADYLDQGYMHVCGSCLLEITARLAGKKAATTVMWTIPRYVRPWNAAERNMGKES